MAVSECYGVDGNRNYNVNFNTTGVSSNPCFDTYPGTHAFSEPETGYVRDILIEYVDRIQIYMDIHSHGNWVLYGYGDRSLPANVAQLHHVGATMGAVMDARKLPQATYYRVGNSATLLYGSSGSGQDYGQVSLLTHTSFHRKNKTFLIRFVQTVNQLYFILILYMAQSKIFYRCTLCIFNPDIIYKQYSKQ